MLKITKLPTDENLWKFADIINKSEYMPYVKCISYFVFINGRELKYWLQKVQTVTSNPFSPFILTAS